MLRLNTKPVLRSAQRDMPLSAGHTGRRVGCATNWEHIRVTVRANHVLMGKERIEIEASQLTSDVLSSGTVSAKLHNTGFQV